MVGHLIIGEGMSELSLSVTRSMGKVRHRASGVNEDRVGKFYSVNKEKDKQAKLMHVGPTENNNRPVEDPPSVVSLEW